VDGQMRMSLNSRPFEASWAWRGRSRETHINVRVLNKSVKKGVLCTVGAMLPQTDVKR